MTSLSDVYSRIVLVKGTQYVDNLYQQALDRSRQLTTQEKHVEFLSIWPYLKKYALYTSEYQGPRSRYGDRPARLSKRETYRSWLELRKPDECRVHTGYVHKTTGYPTVSVRLSKSNTVALALHQMKARKEERVLGISPSNWKETNSVASHLCQVKICLKCAIRESRFTNTLRTGCEFCRVINRKLMITCKHNPPCKRPGENAFKV